MSTNLRSLSVLLTVLLLCSCAKKEFIRYEEGDFLEANANFRSTPLPTSIEMSFGLEGSFLLAKIATIVEAKEEWEDHYTRVGVYGTRIPYNERVFEVREPVGGIQSRSNHRLVREEIPSEAASIKITVNGNSAVSKVSGGVAKFQLSDLKLESKNLPYDANVFLEVDGKSIDASSEFQSFVIADMSKIQAAEMAAIAERRKPENKYKMGFCSRELFPILYSVSTESKTPERNCIYVLSSPRLKVLQAIKDGVLVTLVAPDPYIKDIIFFVKTKKPYVDEDRVGRMLVQYLGPLKYSNVLGAEKTIHSFQFLEDL